MRFSIIILDLITAIVLILITLYFLMNASSIHSTESLLQIFIHSIK